MTQKKSQQESKKQQQKPHDNGREGDPANRKEQATAETILEETEEDARQDAEDEKTLLSKQLNDLSDKHLRLIAEYDNYRKRTLREKIELSKHAGERIILDLLPVVDDFDRALKHLDSAQDLKAVKEGIDLIYNKFNEFLKQQGVTLIEALEVPFDSEIHEAVTKVPAPSEDMKGKIIDCVQKGYKLNDRVIRYPKVVVGE